MRINRIIACLLLGVVFTLGSCKKDEASLVERFDIALKAEYAVPGVPGRAETGTAMLELFDDNTLKFEIQVNNLSSSDNLTASHIHSGGLLSAGGMFVGLVDGSDIVFTGGYAKGTITLTSDQVTELRAKNDLYINVHSEQSPPGLVRGQIGVNIDQAYNVMLSSSVTGRGETGMGYLRVVGNTLTYKVDVNDLSSTDQIVASHIHKSSTGDVIIGFELGDNAQLGLVKTLELTTDQLSSLANDALYINVHSAEEQPGLIRGDIRN